MSSLVVASQVAVETLIVPVPRTSAVVQVWSEFAFALGVPPPLINDVLRKGLDNFLLGSAIIMFLNSRDEVAFEVEMQMDWKKHQAMMEFEPNLDLCPERPFTEQLHTNFRQLMIFLRRAKAEEASTCVELHIKYRDEIYANPDLLAKARAFLGLVPARKMKYIPGVRQPDMTFRFAPVPETTVVVREVWPR
jgi:hypothetical protein